MKTGTQRIARMVGKSTYRDLRDGFTPGSLRGDSDADIKLALGMAQSIAGVLPVYALETRYASTLMHERALLTAWDKRHREAFPKRAAHVVAIQRVGASLAVRVFARGNGVAGAVAHYAWLVHTRRENLQDPIDACLAWLQDQSRDGVNAFLEAIDGVRFRRRTRRRT